MMLVCLWWWYGIFIGKIDPAKGFPMFAYDFVSLGSFAIAFRVWPQPFAFPVTVFVAALDIGVRILGRDREFEIPLLGQQHGLEQFGG